MWSPTASNTCRGPVASLLQEDASSFAWRAATTKRSCRQWALKGFNERTQPLDSCASRRDRSILTGLVQGSSQTSLDGEWKTHVCCWLINHSDDEYWWNLPKILHSVWWVVFPSCLLRPNLTFYQWWFFTYCMGFLMCWNHHNIAVWFFSGDNLNRMLISLKWNMIINRVHMLPQILWAHVGASLDLPKSRTKITLHF